MAKIIKTAQKNKQRIYNRYMLCVPCEHAKNINGDLMFISQENVMIVVSKQYYNCEKINKALEILR